MPDSLASLGTETPQLVYPSFAAPPACEGTRLTRCRRGLLCLSVLTRLFNRPGAVVYSWGSHEARKLAVWRAGSAPFPKPGPRRQPERCATDCGEAGP